jgi:predicted DNA-binding protein
VPDPADSVVLRLSREQFELVREAVDEYIYELEHHTLPPSAREIGRKGSPQRRWAAERVDKLRQLYEWLETL